VYDHGDIVASASMLLRMRLVNTRRVLLAGRDSPGGATTLLGKQLQPSLDVGIAGPAFGRRLRGSRPLGVWHVSRSYTRDEWGLKQAGRYDLLPDITVYGIAVIRLLHERVDALRHPEAHWVR